MQKRASERLIKSVIKIKEVKSEEEIKEIEKAVDTAYEMHTTSMRMAIPGRIEQEIVGKIEGISLASGGPVSFPIILTQDGQTLHNHHHDNNGNSNNDDNDNDTNNSNNDDDNNDNNDNSYIMISIIMIVIMIMITNIYYYYYYY